MRLGLREAYALAVAVLALGLSATAHAADTLTVRVAQGKVHGKTINHGKVKAFLGLPYAAAPVGDLRWKAPQPPKRWEGVRDATLFGARCAQNRLYDDLVFQDGGPSEDCLFLNVYSPVGATKKSKLPTMFWIHGGSYAAGDSSEPRHNGDFLPGKGVVLVTINYRLGVFGFLATAELAKEANGAAGNYGLMDMAAALVWVKANIGQFGGDAGNVTIFGESAGSFAVSALMASPLARGLFHKAIGESGADFDGFLRTGPLDEREKQDGDWLAASGITSLAQLRALPTEKILEAALPVKTQFMPSIDGKALMESVAESFAAGRQAHVPLLAGWNRDEDSSLSDGMTADKWRAYADEHFGPRSAEFLKLFPGETDEQARRSALDYGGDKFMGLATWRWLEAHRKTGGSPVYRYRFELAAPPSKFHPGWLAFHSDEIEYVFGTLDTRPGAAWRPEDRKLSAETMSYWSNFARSGDPNGAGLPTWPKYGKDDELIHLDRIVGAEADGLRGRYEFLSR